MIGYQAQTLALAIALIGSAAFAQPAAAPADAASASKDCVKRHDHGAERGVPSPSRKDCKPAKKSDTKSDKKQAAAQGHDHGKVHKNQ